MTPPAGGDESTVSVSEVQRIAALARLRLDAVEAERMARDMSSILEHMAALAAADTGVEREDDERGDEKGDDKTADAKGDDETGDEAAAATNDPLAARRRPMAPDPLKRPLEQFAPDWRDDLFVVPRLPAVQGRGDDDIGGS